GEPLPASQPVDRPVPGGGRDPGARVVRDPSLRPGLERGDEGVLDGFLREIEVAEDADQGGDGTALLLAEQAADELVRIDGRVGQPAAAAPPAAAIVFPPGGPKSGGPSTEP